MILDHINTSLFQYINSIKGENMKKIIVLFIIISTLIISFTFLNIVQANQQTLNTEMEEKNTIEGQKQQVNIIKIT